MLTLLRWSAWVSLIAEVFSLMCLILVTYLVPIPATRYGKLPTEVGLSCASLALALVCYCVGTKASGRRLSMRSGIGSLPLVLVALVVLACLPPLINRLWH